MYIFKCIRESNSQDYTLPSLEFKEHLMRHIPNFLDMLINKWGLWGRKQIEEYIYKRTGLPF